MRIGETESAKVVMQRCSRELSIVTDVLSDVVYLLGANGRLISANEAFYEATSEKALVHRQGEDGPCPVCATQQSNQDLRAIMETDDPRNLWARPLEISVKVMRDEHGRPQSFLVTLHDLTADRNAQAEKRELERRLQQAQRLEAMGRLAAGAAHDLNNIFALILGDAWLLNDWSGKLPSEVWELAGQISEAGHRGAHLVRQLLNKQVSPPAPGDLNGAVRKVEKLVRRLLGEGIAFHTELAADLGPVLCDSTQLDQVITNLVINARDAMPDGGRLTLTTSALPRETPASAGLTPGDYVQLAVRDTGVGMSPDVLARIFEPFFTTKQLGKGTGIGLATVDTIVRQSGGCIRCETEPGRGTTFFVCLPSARALESAGFSRHPRDRACSLTLPINPGGEDVEN